MNQLLPAFSDTMTRPQRIGGWIYLPVHMFILPIGLAFLALRVPLLRDAGVANMIYDGAGFVFCFTVMLRFMRHSFDTLLDNLGKMVLAVISSMVLVYVLSLIISYFMLFIMGELAYENPNSAALYEIASSYGALPTYVTAVLLAPIVEEVLFRGVLFGAVYKKSRLWAYVVSILVFGIYHVWQFALIDFSWYLPLYVLQYIPAGYALARCYERTDCIWAAVILHALNNALVLFIM